MQMANLGWVEVLLLVLVGAVASAVNSVAGGGSLLSFPFLTLGLHIPEKIANATNSTGLWPGSLSGAFGFHNVLPKTVGYLRVLALPTLTGCIAGAWLLLVTRESLFKAVVPGLLLLAAVLLWLQPKIKALTLKHTRGVKPGTAACLQFLVAMYGGYFGAGMGIMMLAVFTLYMEGTIHEINAVKNWLGVIINLVASSIFIAKGMVLLWPALAFAVGSILGGFLAAKASQKVDPEKLRVLISIYGFVLAGIFAYRAWFAG